MKRLALCLLSTVLLMHPVLADSVRIDGREVPYRLVNGKQMVSRKILAELFPGFPSQQGEVDLAVLVRNPDARILRRNGLIVSVRYYNDSMAAMWARESKDQRIEARTESAPENTDQTSNYRALLDKIVALTNVEREKQSLEPLKTDSLLEKAAEGHSQEMSRLNYFSHTSPTVGRETPEKRIRLAGFGAARTGENIAVLSDRSQDALAREVMEGWMNSPGHRANILTPQYSLIGIGVAKGKAQFYITQNFGGF